MKTPEIQQPENGQECGLFAIANVVEFSFNGYVGKEKCTYNISAMRKHLIFCLENQRFEPFPKLDDDFEFSAKIHTVKVMCACE